MFSPHPDKILTTCFPFVPVSPAASVVADLTPVATVTSSVAVSPVAVVTVSTVPSSVTAVQTMPLLPAALPHSVAQPSAAIPAFPPVMVPPFRVPLPGMHIPLPGKNQKLSRKLKFVPTGSSFQPKIYHPRCSVDDWLAAEGDRYSRETSQPQTENTNFRLVCIS